MTEGYHYTACGLDYVYLQNGFKVRETKHGRAVAIENAQELHETIALAVIISPRSLRGQEVRFLRAQLGLSQDGLAKALRTRRGSVARWEGQPNKAISGTADAALRMFYALKADGHEVVERLVELLTELDDLNHQLAVLKEKQAHRDFERTEEGWQSLPLLEAA